MKWETLKKQVADNVSFALRGRQHVAGLDSVHIGDQILMCVRLIITGEIYDVLKQANTGSLQYATACALADAAHKRIMAWDIRCVGTLRMLFPDHFPKSLRSGNLVAFTEDTDAGDWIIERDSTT